MSNDSASVKGPIAWMARNPVTANLVMVFLLLGGVYSAYTIKKEVFPEFDINMISISVSYSGSSPEEIEQGIILVVEEAIKSVEGIDEISSTASEGSGSVTAGLLDDVDPQKVLQDIKQEIDRISTFPDDAEEPVVSLASRKRDVLQVSLYGDASDMVLRELGEQVRDRLLQQDDVSQVDIAAEKDLEIHVEISQARLRAHGLSIVDVAAAIKNASVEIPGGEIKTDSKKILLRVKDRRDWAVEFAMIPIISGDDGTMLYLDDIAVVSEGFEDSDKAVTFNGKPSISLDVYRIGDETPIGVSTAVRAAMAEMEAELPPGIEYKISRDQSEAYQQRLDLLLKNATIGLGLVLLLLGLFLDFKLAFWVTMGIPISFMGCMLLLPGYGVSINMISMFAFIVALGIVVDDAIIAGENIYEFRSRYPHRLDAAIHGARDVAVPITFSILTNVAAFFPILLVPGAMGNVWGVVSIVVIIVFLVSWVESLFILPAHLAHSKNSTRNPILRFLGRQQQRISNALTVFINKIYGPILHRILHCRYLAVATGLAVLFIIFGFVFSGRIGMILMERVESDYAVATVTLPYGTPMEKAEIVEKRMVGSLQRVIDQFGEQELVTDVFTRISDNEVQVRAFLVDADIRPISTREVSASWRKETGLIAGVESLRFESDFGGPGRGKSLSVELSHRDIDTLETASADLAAQLGEFSQVTDVDDGVNPGKEQLDFSITPEGKSLGFTSASIASQVRNYFQGVEALKQQRGRSEVTVRVRLPEDERLSEYHVESMLVQAPGGEYVPLSYVADMERGRAYSKIQRRDGRRAVTVGADVNPIGETGIVKAALDNELLPALAEKYPGLTHGYEGRQAHMQEGVNKLMIGLAGALLMIYFLLAIPFKSYVQPLIVMSAIPFGIVGAVLGHMIMGYNLSLLSLMGIVALTGVLVNDSLVLIDYANKQMAKGLGVYEAIHSAAKRRFRPIILTTLTTFGGLAPMIFETSIQARFMIPMALSLGFGILFSTLIILVLIPCFVLITDDVKHALSRVNPARTPAQAGDALAFEQRG